MSLNQMMMNLVVKTFLDHAVLYIGMLVVLYFVLDFYYRFVRVNKETDGIDLIYRYAQLRLRRKYRGYSNL